MRKCYALLLAATCFVAGCAVSSLFFLGRSASEPRLETASPTVEPVEAPETSEPEAKPPRLMLEPPIRAEQEASKEIRPTVVFLSKGTYLSLTGGKLAYQTQALEEVTFIISRAYDSNVIPLGWSWRGTDLMREVARKTVEIDAPREARVDGLLDMAALVKYCPGLYEVRTESEAGWSPSCIVVLTDLGVSYGFDDHFNGYVAVRSLSQNRPMEGASVEAISKTNQVLLKGTTDGEGIAHLTPVANAPLKDGIAKLLVRAGEDVAYVELEEGQHSLGAPVALPKDARALVWTDRGAVRPGETVSLMAMVRDAKLHPLGSMPVTLEVLTPSQDVLSRRPVTTDVEGVATSSVSFAEDAVSGTYVVRVLLGEAEIGHETLYVADFVPDRMRVKVAFTEVSSVRVSAETYYGTPVREAEGTVRLFAAPAPLPERWRGWTVGALNPKRGTLTAKAIEASDELEFDLEDSEFHSPVLLTATASLGEPNGRVASASAEQVVFTKPAYLGLKETEVGPAVTLLVPEGSSVGEAVAACTIERLEWHYVLVQANEGAAYRYEWDERVIPLDMLPLELTVRPGEEVTPRFGDLYPGRYRLTAKLADGTTSQMDFWSDAGETGLRSSNPSVLTFETDREHYLPGETATLSFDVPGKGSLLVMEGDAGRLAKARSLPTEGGAVSLPIEIPQGHASGSWRVAVTFVPEQPETQGRSFGWATLQIRQEAAHQLKVALEAPEIVTPGSEVTAKVRLTTPEGKPVAGEVLFFAVDESILAASWYETPDPFDFFYGPQPANLLLGDIYGLLYPNLKIGKDGRIGGDSGFREPNLAKRRALARVVLPPQTGADNYTVSFKVPEELQGAMRLMAVATQQERVGSSERRLIVRPSVVLQGNAPRVVCEGDVFKVSFKVENLDLPEGPYTLKVAEGPTFTGTLAKGEAVTHTVELTAREGIEALVTMGDFTRPLTLPLEVRPAIPEVTSTRFEVLQGEAPEGAEVVDQGAVVQAALDWLARYPYTCTEQLVATGLPYLFREDALAKRQVAYVKGHVLARKCAAGGFSAWPSRDRMDADATLLAAYFLAQEGELPWSTRRALRNVAELRAPDCRGVAAFATLILALEEDANAIQYAEDLINAEDGDDAAFLASLALIKLGYAKEGGEIALEFLRSGKRPSPILLSVENAQSALAKTIFFAVQCGLAKEIPADWLAALVTGKLETTQTCAWTACALEALGKQGAMTLIKRTETSASVRPGQPIHVAREVVDREGKPLSTLRHGELAWVKITLTLPRGVRGLAVRDRLPGGLEYEDANLATRESVELPAWAEEAATFDETQKLPGEVRFFGNVAAGERLLAYPVRAVNCGTYRLPATLVEDMYDPEMTGACAPEGALTITP